MLLFYLNGRFQLSHWLMLCFQFSVRICFEAIHACCHFTCMADFELSLPVWQISAFPLANNVHVCVLKHYSCAASLALLVIGYSGYFAKQALHTSLIRYSHS